MVTAKLAKGSSGHDRQMTIQQQLNGFKDFKRPKNLTTFSIIDHSLLPFNFFSRKEFFHLIFVGIFFHEATHFGGLVALAHRRGVDVMDKSLACSKAQKRITLVE